MKFFFIIKFVLTAVYRKKSYLCNEILSCGFFCKIINSTLDDVFNFFFQSTFNYGKLFKHYNWLYFNTLIYLHLTFYPSKFWS